MRKQMNKNDVTTTQRFNVVHQLGYVHGQREILLLEAILSLQSASLELLRIQDIYSNISHLKP